MDLSEPHRKPPAESIVPMINVVFLLLIFFLMTATIAPQELFDVDPPESRTDTPAETDQPLFVSSSGALAWGEMTGDDVFPAIAASGLGTGPDSLLIIKADRTAAGVEIARLLKRLAGVGIVRSQLVSVSAK
ncbi:MAG: biopolymer transporter ExbD [Pseudomonadota bacterium]